MKVLYISKINAYRFLGFEQHIWSGTDNNLRSSESAQGGSIARGYGLSGAGASTLQCSVAAGFMPALCRSEPRAR
jgi:hypothetical protein